MTGSPSSSQAGLGPGLPSRRTHVIAALATLLANAGLLLLFVQLNDIVQPAIRRAEAGATTIDFVRPPPPRRQPRARPPQRQQQLRRPTVPVPNLPSGIQAPELLDTAAGTEAMLGALLSEGLKGSSDLILQEDQVDRPPELLSRRPPVYPPRALDQEQEGEVALRILVDTDGVVREVEVLGADPPGWFETAAADAVWRWRYSPAVHQGRQVRCWYRQRVLFRLR